MTPRKMTTTMKWAVMITISMNMSESKKTKKDDLFQVEQARNSDSKINRITRRKKILQEYKYGQLKMTSPDKRGMLEC